MPWVMNHGSNKAMRSQRNHGSNKFSTNISDFNFLNNFQFTFSFEVMIIRIEGSIIAAKIRQLVKFFHTFQPSVAFNI